MEQKDNCLKYSNETVRINDSRSYIISKRFFDILISGLGLLIGSPFFALISLIIKIEDPKGPVFFSQTRVGKNENQFQMYKFRSMCANAEEKLEELLARNEIEGAMFKMKEDPRITKVGKFIRKTSIDEFPQLLNVIKGDMSLVGPRPPLPREVLEYSEKDKMRLFVKPGCTGLWQVSGRNKLTFFQMVDLDLEYINNQSLKNDLRILFKTIGVILKSDDAF